MNLFRILFFPSLFVLTLLQVCHNQRPFFPPQLWRMSDKQSIITSHFHLCDCAHQERVIRFAINHLQLCAPDKPSQSINEILWVCGNIYSYTYFPLLFTGDVLWSAVHSCQIIMLISSSITTRARSVDFCLKVIYGKGTSGNMVPGKQQADKNSALSNKSSTPDRRHRCQNVPLVLEMVKALLQLDG